MIHPILALHGFLGKPTDWDTLGLEDTQGIELDAFPLKSLHGWAKAFNLFLQKEYESFHYQRKPILMGYSLGGRLALHALIQNPSLYHAGILISTHPGLSSPTEKINRAKEDASWAHRFLTENWTSLISSWNKRPTFSNSPPFERKEEDYNRKHLADILTNLSLSKQNDLRDQIKNLPLPILWLTGNQDQTYSQLASTIQLSHPSSQITSLPNSSHRTPWDQPEQFKHCLNSFLGGSAP